MKLITFSYLMSAALTYVTVVAATAHPGLSGMPAHMVLQAPFTPFKSDPLRSLNASDAMVGALARQAIEFGVNTVWVPGGMGQFDTLTMDERMELLEAWIRVGKPLGLYIIAHCGSTSIGDVRLIRPHTHATQLSFALADAEQPAGPS